MNPLLVAAISAMIRASVTEFSAWQERRSREADWKPSAKDVDDFMAQIESDTPEALKAKVAYSLGIPWPPPTP